MFWSVTKNGGIGLLYWLRSRSGMCMAEATVRRLPRPTICDKTFQYTPQTVRHVFRHVFRDDRDLPCLPGRPRPSVSSMTRPRPSHILASFAIRPRSSGTRASSVACRYTSGQYAIFATYHMCYKTFRLPRFSICATKPFPYVLIALPWRFHMHS